MLLLVEPLFRNLNLLLLLLPGRLPIRTVDAFEARVDLEAIVDLDATDLVAMDRDASERDVSETEE